MRLSSRLLCCLILYARERPDKPAPAIMKLYLFEFDEMTSLICAVSAKLKTYKETESFLFKQLPMYQRVGAKAFKKDLKNIKFLSKQLGHPQKAFKSIHIAGTNGKGSTSFCIASVLSELGYRVGLYTSPHYKDYRERIKINGQMIPKKYVTAFVNGLLARGIMLKELKPSFFEITVAMAFSYFKEEQVDYAVIETGLGGRLDSTNIITPEISVITNIGLDHTQFLGNTLEAIAKEKAGIIKKNVPVIIGRQQKETTAVFKKVAEAKKAKLTYASALKPLDPSASQLARLPAYQLENRQTAYSTLRALLGNIESKVLEKAWGGGLKKWGYLGRYQRLSKTPNIIADSAHNEMGIRQLFDQIKQEPYKRLHIVFAVVADKDLGLVLEYFPKDAKYYYSQAKIPRAMKKEVLMHQAKAFGLEGKAYSSIRYALAAAKKSYKKGDLILVTGSIFTVAEVV